MRLYWLSLLPLAATAPAWLVRRHAQFLLALTLAAHAACVGLSLSVPLDQGVTFMGQAWVLDSTGRALLVFMYVVSGLSAVIAYMNGEASSYCVPLLAGVGVLAPVVLLPTPLVSLLMLPIALTVLVLTASPEVPSATRGASSFLSLVTLPIPLLLAIFPLLQRLTLFPDDLVLANWAGRLVTPAMVAWWTLFPLDRTTRLWSRDGLSLTPVLLWSVKDWVVLYVLFSLWRRDPLLPAADAAWVLGMVGLATSVCSGVLAALHATPSAVLACAAMSGLGAALQGITAGNAGALVGGLYLLLCRSAAVLLAACCLAAPRRPPALEGQPDSQRGRLPGLALLFAFGLAIAVLAGAPPWSGFWGQKLVLVHLNPAQPHLLPALALSSLGIAVGLVRAGHSLWQTRVRTSWHVAKLQLVLALSLLAVCLWLGKNSHGVQAWIASSFPLWLSPATY